MHPQDVEVRTMIVQRRIELFALMRLQYRLQDFIEVAGLGDVQVHGLVVGEVDGELSGVRVASAAVHGHCEEIGECGGVSTGFRFVGVVTAANIGERFR